MAPRKKSSHAWVYVIWGINGAALIAILVIAVLYTSSLRVSASHETSPTARPGETRKIPPTSYYLSTLTPNPLYTPPVFETPTPFELPNGPRPSVIGFSLAGRRIEVYRFGDGDREYLIVAGIHGGYEGNTIALANELITYINEHPAIIPAEVTLYIIRNMNPDGEARDNRDDVCHNINIEDRS